MTAPLTVLVAVPFSADPTAAAAVGSRPVHVVHRPDLLPPPRFAADHRGADGWRRDAGQEREWSALLRGADVLLGLPGDTGEGLAGLLAGGARPGWVQATAAGAGEQLVTAGLDPAALDGCVVTSAAGIHARPLAEFALAGLLHVAKDAERLADLRARRTWPGRWPMRTLAGGRLLVVGLGGIGREVARLGAAFGMRVTGVARRPAPVEGVERVVGLDDLAAELPEHPWVVLTLPGTAETRGLIDAAMLERLPAGAVLVNVGRGSVVDGDALAGALVGGRLGGAVLDVTDPEPLPPGSPLWDAPRLLLSPHTAALTTDEDDRILDLFTDNLGRYLDGRPLRNVVDLTHGY